MSDSATRVAWIWSACLLAAGPALAQELAEIVVTAQRREQSLQDVPMSVSAVTSADIQMLGIQSQTDIVQHIPNMSFQDNGPAPWYRIRGVGAVVFGDGNESPVAIYVDDVYQGFQASHRAPIFDVERIEVLRGPQGTLYGRNAAAGLVHYISVRPTDSLDAHATVQFGSYGQVIGEGAVGGRLSENVRGRIAAISNTDDGYQHNLGPGGGDFGKENVWAVRGQLEFDMSDRANLRLSATYNDEDGVSQLYGFQGAQQPGTYADCAAVDVQANRCVNFLGFQGTPVDPEIGYSERSTLATRMRMFGISGTATVQLTDTLRLVSITAYTDMDRLYEEDSDASAVGVGVFGGAQFLDQYSMSANQLSQEFRLNGSGHSVEWLAGLYYYSADADLVSTEAPVNQTSAVVETRSISGFAQADFSLGERLRATLGGRYTSDRRDIDASAVNMFPPAPGLSTAAFDLDQSRATWRAGLDYHFDDERMIYAGISTGFKSGEFNTTLLFGGADSAAPARSEDAISYEVGLRSAFFDHRLQIDGGLFYTEVQDKQATVFRSTEGQPQQLFFNFGDVNISGAELELKLWPTDRFRISLSLALLDTEIVAPSTTSVFVGPDSAPPFDGQEYFVDGKHLPGAPGASVTGAIDYDIPLAGGSALTLHTDFYWQDEVYFDLGNSPYGAEGSYGLLNLRLLWKSAGGHYEVQVFGENVLDEKYAQHSFGFGGADYRAMIMGKPAWWGVKFGYRM